MSRAPYRVRVWVRQARYVLRVGPPAQVPIFVGGAIVAAGQGSAVLLGAGPDPDRLLSPPISWAPPPVLAALWFLSAVLLAAGIGVIRTRIPGMALLCGLCTMWGLAYWWSWATGGLVWGWTAAGWFTVTAMWSGSLPAVMERATRR